jgi:hypothetical protein
VHRADNACTCTRKAASARAALPPRSAWTRRVGGLGAHAGKVGGVMLRCESLAVVTKPSRVGRGGGTQRCAAGSGNRGPHAERGPVLTGRRVAARNDAANARAASGSRDDLKHAADSGDAVTHAREPESTRLLAWIEPRAVVGNLELKAVVVARARARRVRARRRVWSRSGSPRGRRRTPPPRPSGGSARWRRRSRARGSAPPRRASATRR